MIKSKKQMFIIISMFTLVMLLGTVTYAMFNYSRTGLVNSVGTGTIAFNAKEGTTISLTNASPIDPATEDINDPTKVGELTINVTGYTTYSSGIEYLVTAADVTNTIGTGQNQRNIPISVSVSVESNTENDPATILGQVDNNYFTNRGGNTSIYKVLATDAISTDDKLLVGYIAPGQAGIDGNLVIKAYLDKSKITVTNLDPTTIADLAGDSEVFTTSEWNSLRQEGHGLSFKVRVEANEGIWVEEPLTGAGMVRKAITEKINAETNACNPTYIEDGITYFSGTNSCVDMNYVWYSGKLWRITAIYPDGAMKLVTQNNITSIAFNGASEQVNFYTDANTTSYMHEWLNEDFYGTLYNPTSFIDTTKEWDMGTTSTISSKPSESVNISANVGLLNSYEYYNSYRCVDVTGNHETCTGKSCRTGYLNIGYMWWLLNPHDASNLWGVNTTGNGNSQVPYSMPSARPSIYLKSGLEFVGDGTSDNPYKIVGDKTVGKANNLINTRLSGEYVKLKNGNSEQVFRIIGVENNKTKIIAMDYAEDKNTRKFATSTGSANTLWGSGTTTGTDTWYEYLNRIDTEDITNTGYYDNLERTYGELFDIGVYQLGTSGYNYKNSICSNPIPGVGNDCAKEFKIGLPRYGEMFATQQAGGSSNSIDMWLINRYSESFVWLVLSHGSDTHLSPTNTYGARPTLHLKSTVKILSGSGTEQDPYVVGLSS